MKISALLAAVAAASTALAAPAAVTVTQHVHAGATVTVQGVVFVSNGETVTSFTTMTELPTVTSTAGVDAKNAANLVAEADVAESVAPAAATTTSQAPAAATTTSQAPVATSQAPATTSTQPQPTGLSDFASTMLSEHNAKRALHKDTPALSWSDTLATYAQNYANNYDCSGNLVHSGGQYGENLALGYSPAGTVDAWYNEISDYNFANPGFSESAGHFTQVVWKSSTEVGCGIKQCGGAWGDYIICSYNPAGNFIGQFPENVEPLI